MPKDLKVLVSDHNVLVPRLENSTSYISGATSLVQRIVKCLFTMQGSDIQNPDFGIGLQNILPKTFNSNDLDKNKMGITEAILRAERQIKEDDAQANDKPEGQLKSLIVKDLSYNSDLAQWIIELSVRTTNNQTFSFKVSK